MALDLHFVNNLDAPFVVGDGLPGGLDAVQVALDVDASLGILGVCLLRYRRCRGGGRSSCLLLGPRYRRNLGFLKSEFLYHQFGMTWIRLEFESFSRCSYDFVQDSDFLNFPLSATEHLDLKFVLVLQCLSRVGEMLARSHCHEVIAVDHHRYAQCLVVK